MDTIIKIGLATLDDAGRLLVVRKRGGATFILAGGKPGGDESDAACLDREVREEIGVGLTAESAYLGTFGAPAADMPGRMVMVRAYLGEIVGEPAPMSEIEEIRWIDIDAPDVPIAESIATGVIPALRSHAG